MSNQHGWTWGSLVDPSGKIVIYDFSDLRAGRGIGATINKPRYSYKTWISNYLPSLSASNFCHWVGTKYQYYRAKDGERGKQQDKRQWHPLVNFQETLN